MNINDFDFSLPTKYIAQSPKNKRSDSKLLVLNRTTNQITNEKFKNIDKYLSCNDLIIINDTKVIPARLYGYRKNTNGKVEIFIERILKDTTILCQLKSTRKLNIGDVIIVDDKIEIKLKKNFNNLSEIEILNSCAKILLSEHGSVPLPPYISRTPVEIDKKFYQTIFAKSDGSVAAPTAALHFDRETIKKLEEKKVKVCSITLHIGMGTFSPIKTEDIDKHNMHSELYSIPRETIELIKKCQRNNGKVVAVGTTVARALESFYGGDYKTDEFHETDIFIKPGYNFKVVDHLITNFHSPKSSLLIMISAFYNKDKVLEAYEFAKKNNYKFFSYGDSTLIL